MFGVPWCAQGMAAAAGCQPGVFGLGRLCMAWVELANGRADPRVEYQMVVPLLV